LRAEDNEISISKKDKNCVVKKETGTMSLKTHKLSETQNKIIFFE
jgi:hypothetical protein